MNTMERHAVCGTGLMGGPLVDRRLVGGQRVRAGNACAQAKRRTLPEGTR
jgi:hypothetical protein